MSVSKAAVLDRPWAGGTRPFAMGSKKLGMWLFIVSDTLTFATLLIVYTYLRMAAPSWPTPFHFSPGILFATVMTFVLLASSFTMVLGVRAMSEGDRKAAVRWIGATMTGGLLFIALHLTEWRSLIAEGMRPFSNPWGDPLFGATFFTITGLHMTHVAAGVLYLGVIAAGVARGRFSAEDVEVSGLYWHFVDLVWMFVFPLVYLMSVSLP
ncbi:MAG: cytochrome c oxidase subunit 3 [Bryobacterales bacterium]|jgi:cytochrome c oxidase subunit III|nr:cytochrome c oxidase subunit 3 [Bryobacterales bacterium]